MRSILILLILGPLGLSSSQKTDFAGDLVECSKVNSIDSCLASTLEELRKYMPVGIRELGLRPTEPLHIKNLNFVSRPGGGVTVNSQFNNVTVEGLSRFVTQKIHADVQRRELSINMFVPKVYIRGLYNVSGTVFIIQVDGNGPFECTLTRVVGQGSGRIVAVGPPDDQHLTVRDINIDFNIKDAKVRLYNLFDGKLDALADTVNDFLNLNSNMIINEVKPQITEEVSKLIQSVFEDAFSRLPVEEFLSKFPPQNAVPRSNRSLRGFRRNQRRRSGPSSSRLTGQGLIHL